MYCEQGKKEVAYIIDDWISSQNVPQLNQSIQQLTPNCYPFLFDKIIHCILEGKSKNRGVLMQLCNQIMRIQGFIPRYMKPALVKCLGDLDELCQDIPM